ncbi:MAG TPA: pilus (MSHA type) biogenesis protein MshL [Gammaproteobacteria bacterium]|nr:pilus (MSHA type) biogenesis protein MshL [Gammaproteobacteria bacterium]
MALFSLGLLALGLAACASVSHSPPAASRHLEPPAPEEGAIPSPVTRPSLLTPPEPREPLDTYTLIATDVPLKEVLFALARDAGLDVDIHPGVSGRVTLNAYDETLPNILDRIARQRPVRFERRGKTLLVMPDAPYLHSYRIDYVNMSRVNASRVAVATQIATTGQGAGEDSGGGGAGNNNSTTEVSSASKHAFWDTLAANVRALLGESATDGAAGASSVIVNKEAGILTARATARQHRQIQAYLDQVLAQSQRQVLIEATVVEVVLNDRYQLGVDWARLANTAGNGFDFTQSLLGVDLVDPPFFRVGYLRANGKESGTLSATVRMLKEFGDVKVLSSPKIMALNNQTALLKVVDNLVYFTLEAETTTGQTTTTTTFTSTLHTVPVGFVMSVTPQVSRTDYVTLNVRPTISRVTGYVNDPNPALAAVDVQSRVPQVQVREIDSVLRVLSGQTAVLGGLIQDDVDRNTQGVPLLSSLPALGHLFKYKNDRVRKSELVIFLRPRVIRHPSLSRDLADFAAFLPRAGAVGRSRGEQP